MTGTTQSAPSEDGFDDHAADAADRTAGFEVLLVPVGPSDADRIDRLAATAAETGGMLQAAVHVLHVFTPSRFERACERLDADANLGADSDRPDPDAVARRVPAVRSLVAHLESPLHDWGVPLVVRGRVSERPSDGIVAAADAVDAKRVLVGGRRRTPTGKAVFGSTAQAVMLNAPCPVTFVREP